MKSFAVSLGPPFGCHGSPAGPGVSPGEDVPSHVAGFALLDSERLAGGGCRAQHYLEAVWPCAKTCLEGRGSDSVSPAGSLRPVGGVDHLRRQWRERRAAEAVDLLQPLCVFSSCCGRTSIIWHLHARACRCA